MNGGHMVTSIECDTCHTTDEWLPDIFVHSSPSYPGDHRGNLECTECHTSNTDTIPWPNPAYQPDCAACHANDYEGDEHIKHENPETEYTVSELRDCTTACHTYEDSTLTTIRDFEPGPEHTVNQNDF